jgi:hypothetical protein
MTPSNRFTADTRLRRLHSAATLIITMPGANGVCTGRIKANMLAAHVPF